MIEVTDDFSKTERKELSAILSHPLVGRALIRVAAEARVHGTQMLGSNLASAEGINQAVQLQGKAQGLMRGIEILVDLSQDPDEKEEENGEA